MQKNGGMAEIQIIHHSQWIARILSRSAYLLAERP